MDKHSIADYLHFIGATVPAEGHGWRKIKCPFHEDGHASAGVNFKENRFKCHGCGVSGDTYDLIMHKEGGNYREAVQYAEAISLTGNAAVSKRYTPSKSVSSNTGTIGRRSESVSSGSSGASTSRTRRLRG
jgi:DNA primase